MGCLSVKIDTAPVFEPLLAPNRYKAVWGGRGSGKSWFLASLMIEEHLAKPGRRSVCIREVQKTLKESAKHLLENTIDQFGLSAQGFKSYTDRIATPGDGTIIFQGMQDHTAESIKSLEGFDCAWVEEAQTLSARSLQLLRPTIRAPGSELHFSWNPRRRIDPVDQMFRGSLPPTGAQVVKANWNDNPWFPAELEQERKDCLRDDPDQYDHIWEGGYVTVAKGAYFAQPLAVARKDGRIAPLIGEDPNLIIRLFADLGGTGAKADNFVFWAQQVVGTELRWINHYEVQGQPIAAHINWMGEQGYTKGRTKIYLPHDGQTHDRVYSVSFESAFRDAGYEVEVVPNQGKGAAKLRVEAARRLFPRMRFDETKCDAGLQALGWYHEKHDETRDIGLGPDHDWSSHSADAFGLGAIVHEEPSINLPRPQRTYHSPTAWMGR